MVTHDKNIQISILLDAPPAGVSGFIPLIVGAEADGTTLDGDVVRSYSTSDAVDADETAGFLSAFIANAVRRGFSQNPRPAIIKVGKKRTIEDTTYALALSNIATTDDNFYGVCIASRLAADQVSASAWAESRDKIFIFQSDDPAWLTAGIPTDFTSIEDSENSAVIYHDEDARSEDFSWLCNRLAFDPDSTSAPWDAPLNASVGYTASLSTTEVLAAEANSVNLLLPFGPVSTYVASEGVGVNLAGRQISEILTKHWFTRRLRERVAQEKVTYSGRGQKIPVSIEGIGIIQPLVDALLSQGVNAGHFVAGQVVSEFPIPTDADRNASRLRGGGSAQLAVSAGLFEFEFIFSRQPVVEAE